MPSLADKHLSDWVDAIPDTWSKSSAAINADIGHALYDERVAHLQFTRTLVIYMVVLPLLFFLLMVPLAIDEIPYEPFMSCYWLVMSAGVIQFPSAFLALCFGHRCTARQPLHCWLALNLAVIVAQILSPPPCSKTTWVVTGGIIVVIYEPSLRMFVTCLWQGGEEAWQAAAHVLVMCSGAVPCAMATAMYGLITQSSWFKSEGYLVLRIAIWTIIPFALKLLSSRLWRAGCPSKPEIGHVLASYYVELSFTCLGLAIFMRSPMAAASYTSSFAVSMGMKILWGTLRAYRCWGFMGSLALHRLVVVFEAFAIFLGRLSGFLLYTCFSTLSMVVKGDRQIVLRYSLVLGENYASRYDVNIYRETISPIMGPWIGVAGMVVVVFIFVAFLWLLPVFWHVPIPTSQVVPTDTDQLDTFKRKSASDHPSAGENDCVQCETSALKMDIPMQIEPIPSKRGSMRECWSVVPDESSGERQGVGLKPVRQASGKERKNCETPITIAGSMTSADLAHTRTKACMRDVAKNADSSATKNTFDHQSACESDCVQCETAAPERGIPIPAATTTHKESSIMEVRDTGGLVFQTDQSNKRNTDSDVGSNSNGRRVGKSEALDAAPTRRHHHRSTVPVWTEGLCSRASLQQCHLLHKFAADYTHLLSSLLIFVFAMTTMLVNLAVGMNQSIRQDCDNA